MSNGRSSFFTIALLALVFVTPSARAQDGSNVQSSNKIEGMTEDTFQTRMQAGESDPAPDNVIFSEICYWPKAGEPEWVELSNLSKDAVDVKGWRIIDGQTINFAISNDTLKVIPGESLVIVFDGTGKPMERKGTANFLHTNGELKGNVLGDDGGHLALYSNWDMRYFPALVRSYVDWGWSPGRVIADMMKARQVPFSDFFRQPAIPGSGKEILMMPGKTIQRGGSIGLIPFFGQLTASKHAWGIFMPSETNPGSIKTKRGITLAGFNADGSKTSDGVATLAAVAMESGIKYQFQLCKDKQCNDVVTDVTTEFTNYVLEKPIPPKTTYYWHARLIYPDGSATEWSEVRSLTH